MPALEREQQEKFAQGVASGCKLIEAYRRAGYKGGQSQASVLARNDNVRRRIVELRLEQGKRFILKKERAMMFLTEIIVTPVGEIDESSQLAQEVTTDEVGEMILRKKVKMPSKLEALKLLSQLCGWEVDESTGREANVLAGLVYKICTQRGIAYPGSRKTLLNAETGEEIESEE